jgi:hypothetical protein
MFLPHSAQQHVHISNKSHFQITVQRHHLLDCHQLSAVQLQRDLAAGCALSSGEDGGRASFQHIQLQLYSRQWTKPKEEYLYISHTILTALLLNAAH